MHSLHRSGNIHKSNHQLFQLLYLCSYRDLTNIQVQTSLVFPILNIPFHVPAIEMLFTKPTALALSTLFAAASVTAVPTNFGTYESVTELNRPCHEVGISAQWRDTIVSNWATLWGGDYTYLNKTVAPDFQLYQDRFPTGNGSVSVPVDSSTAFLAFVKQTRADFSQYGFIDDLHFGEDNLVTYRWTLDATWAGSKTA